MWPVLGKVPVFFDPASLALWCGPGRLTLRSPLRALSSWTYRTRWSRGLGMALRPGVDSTFRFADLRTRAGSRLRFRSLISSRFPRALDIEAGTCTADGAVLIELPHALVEALPSKMLGHQVGWVLGPQDLSQLQLL